MEFLEGLLFCLMVNGISSNKYYYKRIGNGFDVIFGPHAIGDYKELKPPKSIKVNYDMRGERPGECIDGRFLCRIPYQRSMTEHFECISDYQCPRFHKCCQLKCFLHKVCQPAFGADLFTTIRSTTYKETSTSTETETTQPPEPPPQVNLDTRTSAYPIKTTEVTSNESPSSEPSPQVNLDTRTSAYPIKTTEVTSNESPSSEPSEEIKTSKITTREPETNISQKITISSTPTSGETREETSTFSTESTNSTAGITNKINEISLTVMTSEGPSISKYFSNTEINTFSEDREQKTTTITTGSPNIEYKNMTEISASSEIKDETTTGMVVNKTESPTNIEINTSTESMKPTIGTIEDAVEISSSQVTMEVLSIEELSATEITSTTMKKIDVKSTEFNTISPLVETETSSNTEISVSPIKRYKTSTELMKSTSSFTESSETTRTGQPNTTEDTTGRPEPQKISSIGTGINFTLESIKKITTESQTTDVGSNTEITSNKFYEPESTAQTETSSKTEQQTSDEYVMKYSTTISSEYIQSTEVDILAKNVTTISAEMQMKKSDKTEMIGNSSIRIIYANETSSQKTVTSKGNTSTRETVNSTNFSPSTETSATVNINDPSAKPQGFPQNRTAHDMMESGFDSGNGSEDDTEAGGDKSNETPQKESEINKNATTMAETFDDDEDMMKSGFGSGDGSGDGSEDDTEVVSSDKPDETSQKEPELHKNATTMTETSEVGEDMMESGFGSGDGDGNGSEDDTEAEGSDKPDKTSQKESELHKNATTIADTFEDDEDMMESGFGSGDGSGNGIKNDTKADGSDKPDKTSKKKSELHKNATTIADTSKVDEDIMESGFGSGDGSGNGNKIDTEAEDNDKSDKNPQKGTELDKNATTMATTSKDDNDMMESGFVSGNGSKDDTEAGSIDRSDETFQKGLELHKNVTTMAESSEDGKHMIESGFGSGDGNGNDDNTTATRSHKPNKTLQTSSELLKNTTEIITTSPETTESTSSTGEGYDTKTDQFSKMVVDEKRKINLSSTDPGDRSDEVIVTGSTNFTTSTGSDKPDKTPQEELELHKNTTSRADAFEDGEDMMGSGFGGSNNSGNESEDDTEVGGEDKPNKTPQKGSQLHENVRTRADTFEDDEDMIGTGFGSGDGSGNGSEDDTEADGSYIPDKTSRNESELHKNATTIAEISEVDENIIESGFGSVDESGNDSKIDTEVEDNDKSEKNPRNRSEPDKNATTIAETSEDDKDMMESGFINGNSSKDDTEAGSSYRSDETSQKGSELHKNVTTIAETSENDKHMIESGFVSGDVENESSGYGNDDNTETTGSDKLNKTLQTSSELPKNNTEITTTLPKTTESTASSTGEEYGTKTNQSVEMVIDEGRKLNITFTDPGARSDEILVTVSTNFTKATGSDKSDETLQEEVEPHKNATSTADTFEDSGDMMGSGFGIGDGSGNTSEDDTEAGGSDKPDEIPQRGPKLHENARSRADTFEDGSDDGGENNTEATNSDKPNNTVQMISELLYNTDITTTSPKVGVETSANTRNSSPTKIGDKTATEISMNQTQSPTTTNINTFKKSIKQIANNNKTTVEITEILSVEESSANTTTTRSGQILVTGSINSTKASGSEKPNETPQNELKLHKNATSTANTFEDDEDMMGYGSGDGSGNGSDDDTEAADSDKPGRTHQKGWELLKNSTTREDEVII